ncbi:MAG TPA: type VI secretion system membrane subunit TssM [Methylophilaceae bacterium]|jgi:type VI secretion system protein ImpL
MNRVTQFIIDRRTLAVLGFAAFAAFLLLGTQFVELAVKWIGVVLVAVILTWFGVKFYQHRRAKKAASDLGDALESQAKADDKAKSSRRGEIDVIRTRMIEAVDAIKTSKLGITSGSTALYELPWYMVIGNPAAGKSSAIVNSGLQFPFADKYGAIVQGVGGTRNCDWFFTADGILLDTAGRYAIHEEDREEWFGFLGLLKKYRKNAPINGVIIAVSISELAGNKPEFAINLAKNLRQRVQELTERLEVFAPVYVVFTKVDLISGFNEFFHDISPEEAARVWGATQKYNQQAKNEEILSFFDQHFDALYDGLKEMSLASMSTFRGEKMPTGLLTFPIEFAAIKASLRSFILTFFEDNPFQFRPVFRGFYFTSALQEGAAVSHSSERVAKAFDLNLNNQTETPFQSKHGFFLLDLFRKVIFEDKGLVAQYTSRNKIRLRATSFLAATLLLGILLAGWMWSYKANSQLITHVEEDMRHAIRLQQQHADLQSRFDALELLQSRLEQLQQYRVDHPISLGLGLYQGDLLEQKLRLEYFSGVREVMLKPVAGNLESFLTEVNVNADANRLVASNTQAKPLAATVDAASPASVTDQLYQEASPIQVEDAYKALKTYLMLSDRTHAEEGHLNDQITRFWRSWLESNRGQMSREKMIRSAENVLVFYLAQMNDPSWPTIESKLALVDQARESLRQVVHGMPARERVYADIKARASTRYPSVTVERLVGEQNGNIVAGSFVVPSAFTREAWDGYIRDAFKDAANKQLQSSDWVLKTATSDDLTLEGSPEQIMKSLTQEYKLEYSDVWQKFLQGVVIKDIANFDQAVAEMNQLGDPKSSQIKKLIEVVYDQTSWDNPSLVNAGIKKAQNGLVEWFRSSVMGQAPSQVNMNVNVSGMSKGIPMGPVGQRFSGVAKLVQIRDGRSIMQGYLENLSKVRTRFNQIHNQGDIGPGTRQLMQQTLDGSGSELSDALKYVDEQMLQGMNQQQKDAVRPILVRPLMQAFSAMIKPTESELNRAWMAKVYDPFKTILAGKYPFTQNSKIEAGGQEIAQIFGPDGSIAKFFSNDLAQLTVQRGAAISSRTWADMGIHLSPQVASSYASWIAPVSSGGAVAAGAAATVAQTLFQMQPLPAGGTLEYTIEIDGQQLRYRNVQAAWANFVWPNPQGAPGAKITAVTFDGRSIEIVNEPGRYGLEKLLASAQRKRKEDGVFELSWTNGGITVAVNLKLISSPQVKSPGAVTVGGSPTNQGYRGMDLPKQVAGEVETSLASAPVQTSTQDAPK